MTKEEFLKKNEWYCEEKFNNTTGKIKVVKIYFHNGDTVEKGDKIFDFNSSSEIFKSKGFTTSKIRFV